MLDIMKDDGFSIPANIDPSKVKVVAITTADLTPLKDGKPITDERDFPKEGITQEVYVGEAAAEGLKAGDTIYVLHWNINDAKWETIPATVKTADGGAYVDVTFHSLSPVGFVKVMSNGDVIALTPNGEPVKGEDGKVQVLNNAKTNNAKNTTSATTGKSPKTGEF